MTLSESFVVAAGTVTGRDHLRAKRDGQDGCAVLARPDLVAAVVTDGCSSGATSEVGARLGAAWIAALVEEAFRGANEESAPVAAQAVVTGLIARLRSLYATLPREAVGEMLLFGFLAAVVTRDAAIVFGIGDGTTSVDGKVTVIDPGPENAPTYAAYALLGANIAPRILFLGPRVDALAIATDGVDSATLADVIADPRYDANTSLLRKRLVVLSDQGRFSDDATVALVRRRS